MISSATLSACGTYRYTLHRQLPSVPRRIKPCLFVMLNPSTADATKDDPTIRRCISFAKREGCTGITVVNLFAPRATDPDALAKHPDPVGPENAQHLAEQVRAHRRIGIIIAAWGANPITLRYAPIVVLQDAGAFCLGMTAAGHPRHPLYVRGDQPLIPWVPPCQANSQPPSPQ